MHIIINNSSMVPIYEQIVNAVKTMILSGELKQGDPLGSIRTLAAELKISALTVKKAYDQLENEGYTVTVHGKGSYVADGNTELDALRELYHSPLILPADACLSRSWALSHSAITSP